MSKEFTDKQRRILYKELGQPVISIEFDVFADNKVSMWTHLDHSMQFEVAEHAILAIQKHLESFIAAKKMCPFCTDNKRA